ncbi:MAG: TonB-dependent receptor plug domain-containing protein, partial [Acidobacteriaceae bacterium]|nr:TonB-dependent receptor plug domain-containing protein [Acidobacteriaceae bacterium]
SLEELSRIEVVSASKEPTPVLKSPVAIYVITGDDIRRAGASTIPDALRLAPGVEVAQVDASKWSVGIRGFGSPLSRSVLVLIDGRSVYTPLFAGTYWDVQDTLLEDIDRIEVIRGPGGTVWGPNAVNGVINIVTKSSKDTQGTFASGGGGNQEQGVANVRYGGTGRDGLTYRIYGKAFTRGPEYHTDHDNFDDWRGARSGFRMDWARGARDTLTVQGDIYKQEDGERVTLSSYVPHFTRNVDGNAQLSGGNVLARWTRTVDDGESYQVQVYYDRTNRYELNFGERRDTYDIDFIAKKTIKQRHKFLYGLGGRLSDGRFVEVSTGLVFDPARRIDNLITGFLEDDITLIDQKLYLTLGSKILHTNFSDVEFQPTVRLLWAPTARQSFWASFTHAVRTPSRAEREFYISSYVGTATNGLPFFGRYNANPEFAPELMNGWEIGHRTLITRSLYIDTAGFFNHYHDLFSQDLAAPQTVQSTLPFPSTVQPGLYTVQTAQFRNDFYGITTGVEIAPEWRPREWWRLRASYAYLQMNLNKRAGTPPGTVPASVTGSSPKHEASAQSSFDLWKRLQLDLMFRYVSALPAQNVAAYETGDVRLSWRLGAHVEFAVAGRNLLQPHHVEYIADPGGAVQIRRNVFATLAWR